jgi:hypothetical protein
MSTFDRRAAALSGVVALLRVTADSSEKQEDGKLFRYASEARKDIQAYVDKQVKEILGEEFVVSDVEIRDGSAIILIYVAAVGTVFLEMREYRHFIKRLNRCTQDVTRSLKEFLEDPKGLSLDFDIETSGWWQPGPSIEAANNALISGTPKDFSFVFLAYTVARDVLLFALIIWLIFHYVR